MKDKLVIDRPYFGNDDHLMVIYIKNYLSSIAFTIVATIFQGGKLSFSIPNELIVYIKELFGCWNISLLGSLLRSLLGERQPW